MSGSHRMPTLRAGCWIISLKPTRAGCSRHNSKRKRERTVSEKKLINRRQAVAAIGGASLLAAPSIVRAQAPLKVTFVQQRGLLYLPVDEMVTGGILQKEADKLGLGKVEATATTLSGPGPVLDAILSGSADYGTAALPSLLTLWE